MIVLTTGVALAVTCVIFIVFEWRTSLAVRKEAVLSTGRVTADASSAVLAFGSAAEGEKLLASFRAEPGVRAAALYDAAGKLFAQYRIADAASLVPAAAGTDGLSVEGQRLILFHPVVEGSTRYGTLYLRTDLRDMYTRLARYAGIALLIFAGSLVSASFLGRILQQTISQPIVALAGTARAISQEHNYSVRAEPAVSGELALLTSAFNQMLDEIQRQQAQVQGELAERKRAQAAEAREKQLLATTLASIGDAVIVTDVQGQVTFLNSEAERLTGWSNTEAAGHALPEVFRIVNEETRHAVENPVDKVLRLGGVVGLANHTILLAKDGRDIPIDDSAAPIGQPGGPLFGVVLVFRDFTERRNTQVELRRKQAELDRIINRTPFMLTRCDRDLRYQFVSQSYAEMLGRTPEQVAGTRIIEIMGEEGLKTVQPYIDKVLQGQHVEYETEVSFQNVGAPCLHVVYDPDHDAEGNVIGWFASIIDVTARKEAEQKLREHQMRLNSALEAAQAADRAKDRFLATLSHELRTPLTPVLITVSVLQRDESLPPDTRRRLGLVRRNVEMQKRMIDDLLDLSRIIHDKLDLQMARVDAHELVRSALDLCIAGGGAGELQVVIQLEAQRYHLDGDAARLQQVFWNLIQNAIKFTPGGGTLTISSANAGDRLRVTVADTGRGIEAAMLARIFEPFEQGNRHGGASVQGLGLGLGIAQRIVAAHGGTLSAASDGLDRGAVFTVELNVPENEAVERLG